MRQGGPTIQFQAPRLGPAVKGLLIALVGVYFLQLIVQRVFQDFGLAENLGFNPHAFVTGSLWQILTYPFLHGSLGHLGFNALTLYLVGAELELRWGTKRFLTYYMLCAVGGAVLQTLIWLGALVFTPSAAATLGNVPIIGASGALYGLLAAFGRLYKNAQVLLFFLVPMKAGHFVILLIIIEILSSLSMSATGLAHLVHLGGLFTGLFLLIWKGNDLSGKGGGGFFRRRKVMDREEVKKRLNLIVNRDDKDKDGKFPITWN